MNITLSELKSRGSDAISLLEIVSMEGRYYLARLHLSDGVRVLSDETGQALLYKGSWAVQDDLRSFHIGRTEILPPAGYDEMVGLPDTPDGPNTPR